MADKANKLVREITSMNDDFAQWYTDVVKKAELIEYSKVRGCMILRPNGYAIWENIQKNLDAMFKKQALKTYICHYLSPKVFCKKKKTTWKGSLPKSRG